MLLKLAHKAKHLTKGTYAVVGFGEAKPPQTPPFPALEAPEKRGSWRARVLTPGTLWVWGDGVPPNHPKDVDCVSPVTKPCCCEATPCRAAAFSQREWIWT